MEGGGHAEKPLEAIEEHFSKVTDPRKDRTKDHKLIDIIAIVICAVICGAEGWVDLDGPFHGSMRNNFNWLFTPHLRHGAGVNGCGQGTILFKDKLSISMANVCAAQMINNMKGKQTRRVRFYISSLPGNAERLLHIVRKHWSIENDLHWVLDVALNEDHSGVRKDRAPENFAVLRHIARNLLKQEKTAKGGIHAKQLQAGWKEDYLFKVLAAGN